MTSPFWVRVAIQAAVETRDAFGGTEYTYENVAGLSDVEARVTASSFEDPVSEMTVIRDAFQVQLRGAHPTVRTGMVVLDGTAVYDIRNVVYPPPFGTPVTILDAVVVAI